MAVSSPSAAALLDLPLEVLTGVCEQLDFRDLIRVAATCTRFRHGDGGFETLELPTKSQVVTAVREHAFPGGVGIPSTRPIGCLQSWIAYVARRARQRRCREAPPIAASWEHSLFLDAAGRLLACGKGATVGHGDDAVKYARPTSITAMAGVRMRSIAAGARHSLALGWDGRVYSWGDNEYGQLGRGDTRDRPLPALVEGLEGVRDIAAAFGHTLAATESECVFHCGKSFSQGSLRPIIDTSEDTDISEIVEVTRKVLLPIIVEGFGGVRVRRVFAGNGTAFAIGENGELFYGGAADTGISAMATRRTSPRPSASRRCGAFG
jgi:hypothetical protein